ncbi:MFS transporter, partial [Clostridium perfringens]
ALAMLFVPKNQEASINTTTAVPSVLHDMADGIRYVLFKRDLLRLSLCVMVVGLGVGLISPLSVFLVTERLGLSAQDLQWITIPYGVGEILGGIVTFMLASRIAPGRLLMMGLIVNGAGILLLGLSTVLWLTKLSQF